MIHLIHVPPQSQQSRTEMQWHGFCERCEVTECFQDRPEEINTKTVPNQTQRMTERITSAEYRLITDLAAGLITLIAHCESLQPTIPSPRNLYQAALLFLVF